MYTAYCTLNISAVSPPSPYYTYCVLQVVLQTMYAYMWCNFTVLNKGMHTISKISVLLYTYYAYCMICIHVCIFMYIICIYSHVYDCTCTAVLGMKQTITYATVYHMLVRSCCLTQRYMYQNQNLSMRSLQIQWFKMGPRDRQSTQFFFLYFMYKISHPFLPVLRRFQNCAWCVVVFL